MRLSILFRISMMILVGVGSQNLSAKEAILLPESPSLSPDGKRIAFSWRGDIWVVPSSGGTARSLTRHPAKDSQPKWSPDGKEIAFISDREGSPQVFLMPSEGGSAKQVTFHSSGYQLEDWSPDGSHILVSGVRDRSWKNGSRFYLVNVRQRGMEKMLFDDYGANGVLSPDGTKLLFTRERAPWWRKGYRGSECSQIWLYDLTKKTFEQIRKGDRAFLWPLWRKEGGFYFVSDQKSAVFNLWQYDPQAKAKEISLTHAGEDAVVFPTISRDGSTIVYRELFDLYLLEPGKSATPRKIELYSDEDSAIPRMERRVLDTATEVAFTATGLQIAMISGGDLWVMDTELKEPKLVLSTPELERNPVFSLDGKSLYFIRDQDGGTDIWEATRENPALAWWENDHFKLKKITQDREAKSQLTISPRGNQFALIRGLGDLWIMDRNGENGKKLISSWNPPRYDWSPDGNWLVYAVEDDDFNSDIWVQPIDGSRPAFNISRHPYNDSDPVWSPDGKIIAFLGARDRKDNIDIHYVYLQKKEDQQSPRDRLIQKAKQLGPLGVPGKSGKGKGGDPTKKNNDNPEQIGKENKENGNNPESKKGKNTESMYPKIEIDFDHLHDRIHRITIANSNERSLFWSADSKKLAFTATVDGNTGTYTLEIPEGTRPVLLSSQVGSQAKWLKNNRIVWLSAGIPGSISGGGGTALTTTPPTTSPIGPRLGGPGGRGGRGQLSAGNATATTGGYRFTVYQELDLAKRNQAAFDMCWRIMRDQWYDERLGNRDWNRIRQKYLAASETPSLETLSTVIYLMLGELNGSHLGFSTTTGRGGPRRGMPASTPIGGNRNWSMRTAHLGVHFDPTHGGKGLRIEYVIPGGPADQEKSKLKIGEIILTIDGHEVMGDIDLTQILNGVLPRDIVLEVRDNEEKVRKVTLRAVDYAAIPPLLYQTWVQKNLKEVEVLSQGQLGYLHIRGMDMPSFQKFEEELYNAGAGKNGLIIDVRENGGGFTTDLLLTALTQPKHSITIPRGGRPGYPQDRTIYATWSKPIVVLCNQNSFSNAEIFSHAIKTLKRGHLVGVTTAGGVISTGGTSIMDIGFLRLPFRGWFLLDDGEDMELHGAVPDYLIWPMPGETQDSQLLKAIEVLKKDVEIWAKRKQPKLKKATER